MTLDYELVYAATNMGIAMVCGAIIGTERQARHRMAGVRTNALVALSAASFVLFAALFPGDASPTRVAAQIVSGIGFLGGGIIFRDGFTVHGLNTAATLWCSAAVGMIAGTGEAGLAALLTGMVMVINLALRPLVNWLKRRTAGGKPSEQPHRIEVVCETGREAEFRGLIVQSLMLGRLRLQEIVAAKAGPGEVALTATLTGDGETDFQVEQVLARLAVEPGLVKVRLHDFDDG